MGNDVGRPLDERDACPACGSFYSLGRAPLPVPEYLCGDDDAIDQFERDNPEEYAYCSVCGWSEAWE